MGDTFQQDVMIERRTETDNRRVEICRKKRRKKIVGEEKGGGSWGETIQGVSKPKNPESPEYIIQLTSRF